MVAVVDSTPYEGEVDADPLLEIEGLEVVGPAGLLVSVSGLRVGTNESVGIVGESGSGKSLTALAALGLLPDEVRSAGSIRFMSKELIATGSRSLRRMRGGGASLLMQDPGTMLNPLRRCVTHVEEGLGSGWGPSRRKSRRSEALRRLAEVGIDEEAAMRFPFQVSGGMAQRAGLAAALARDPRLLIADEPTTALDVTTQREILSLLARLRRQRGMSLLLITHDLQVAFEVCDRIYVMYGGSILEEASPRSLIDDPMHPYSQALLMSEPSVRVRRERLNTIPGFVARASETRGRCTFAPRCTWVRDVCVERAPALVEVQPGHATACIRVHEIRERLKGPVLALESGHGAYEETSDRPPPLLEMRGLVKSFKQTRRPEVKVLRGIDLRVGQGESVGLVGESGSGKTTLARCLMGLETPSSGSVLLSGLELADYGHLSHLQRLDARRCVQMVFQNPYASLNPARSIGATLAEAATIARDAHEGGRRSPSELLELVGLPPSYTRRRPAALSGGERQRVGIARALAVQPKLLVCDEPTSALDVSVQAQIINLLRDLQRELGLALLFVTHDLGVVRQVADHLYVMAKGELVEQGVTQSVLDDPKHPYTQLLISSVAHML